ncbi:TPA: hypothetical protein ODO31_002726 [Escherichia coli]|nr:hypothetical protein [Escherichia coli]
MYETTKLSIHEVSNVEWNIVTCKIVSCNAARTDAGHKSTITGYMVMAYRGLRVRFIWKARQLTPFREPSMPLEVEQDYLSLPEIDGATLVDSDGRKADFEVSLKVAQAVINNSRGKWIAKEKHVVRLSRW